MILMFGLGELLFAAVMLVLVEHTTTVMIVAVLLVISVVLLVRESVAGKRPRHRQRIWNGDDDAD